MHLVLRPIAILFDPLAQWRKIEKEAGDPFYLMISYVAALALIPAVFGFLGACAVGVVVPGSGTVRATLFDGAFGAMFGYLESFVLMVVLGLIVSLTAPLFGGRRNFAGALKLVVYSYTPVWLTGIFLLLPGLRFLMLFGFYGAYLLLAGVQPLTKTPAQKSLSFAALIVVLAGVLTLVAAGMQHALFGALPS
jgi:hypothetical protein